MPLLEKISYHVYVFTDKASCEVATPLNVPDNCWCCVVTAPDNKSALTQALDGMSQSQRIFFNNGDILAAAIVATDELATSEFKKYEVKVVIKPTYVIGDLV